MAELNINNVVLDDNSFDVLPDGDYHFTVDRHEIGYYSGNSDKIPPNTQVVTCYLSIPYYKDGVLTYATVRNNLNIYNKALFAIRQFTDCIGLTPEKGRASLDLEKMDGLTGICAITTAETKRGDEVTNVQIFYAPSKAPVTTANDEAWQKKDGFTPVGDEVNPFNDDPTFN
jgi:hypothetical protein